MFDPRQYPPVERNADGSLIRLKLKQWWAVKRLIREHCCNLDPDGCCLLLDDGDEHSCVQLISCGGIYCNYFLRCVLPTDFDLYTEISGGKMKPCKRCGKDYFVKSPRQMYCVICGRQRKKEKAAERQQRKRDKRHAFGG